MPSAELAQRSRAFAVTCGGAVAAIGALALAGWAFDNDRLRAVFFGDILIKTNTAIALLSIGIALCLLVEPAGRSRWRTAGGRALALLAAALGALTMVQHLTGLDLGIDQLLFSEPSGSPATASPNRMGPPAAACFPLLGGALLLIDRAGPRTGSFQRLALVALLVAQVPLLGYVFDVRQLYGVAQYTGIALHTAVGLTLAAAGVLFARPDAGFMRRLLSDTSGGLLLRRLLPAAILLPVALGRLRLWGQDAGLYDLEFGRTLLTVALMVVFTGMIWWTASVVERHAQGQARAEAAEREMHAHLLTTLDSERHARAAAERSNRLKDEFLATLSHELRTPLHAILGWVQLLVRGSLKPEDARRGLEAIERNSRLQAQLIEDLLDMSRIESGKVRLDLQQVDLSLVVESALAAAAPSASAKGLTLERQIDPEAPVVHGDPARLHQILWNLLANAIKFTPAGGRILVTLVGGPSTVEVSIQDSGIGINPALIEDVFDRFRQADPSTTRRFGGLGLGLAIARQLTEMHGGTLTASSPGEGRGATFTVRLPLTQMLPLVRAETHAGGRPSAAEPAEALHRARVLVVDDQGDSRELVARVLTEHGADVQLAASVDDALARLEERPADVLVSDISMPGRDGYDLIGEVQRRWPDLPAIALTAFARPEDAQRARAAGFSVHLPKPLSPDRLVQAVATLLDRPTLTRDV